MQKTIQIKKSTFHQWNNLRKATLFAGITILILIFIATLWRWAITTNDIVTIIDKFSSEEKAKLVSEKAVPAVLPSFWAITGTFTWISNLAIGIGLILYAIYPKNWIAQRALFLVNTYITITFVVFWTLIFPVSIKHFEAERFINSVIVHFLNPLICFIFVILNRKNIQITKTTIWLSSVVLVAYWFFALFLFFLGQPVLNALDIQNPTPDIYKELSLVVYDFLNFKHPLFYKGDNVAMIVFLNFVIFVVGFLLTPAIGFGWKYALKIPYDKVTESWNVQ
ncbi:MAGa3780 family membrane protein [Mycoplasma sp. 005V]|uniref:MAGa3780 family membrane protein n=1 Tax=unclassified Mycoplasma TaxID=2683645 RepID=UPI003A884A77